MVEPTETEAGKAKKRPGTSTSDGAMKESTMIQFAGDTPVWMALSIAFAVAAFVFWLYRLETRGRGDRYGWQLPLLRATAVFLTVFILAGPVLHHERVIRELGRLFVFIDDSDSMSLTDEQMDPARKMAALQTMGVFPRADSMKHLDAAGAQLARAQTAANLAMRGGAEFPLAATRLVDAVKHLEEAMASMRLADVDFNRLASPSSGFVRMDLWRGAFADELFNVNRRRGGGALLPEDTRFVEGFALPETGNTDFVAWFRGYFVAPRQGKYTFWIASDDRSTLSVSRDVSPDRAKEVARVDASVGVDEFGKNPRQESRKLPMKAGERHYIEAIHEAGGGENHLSVVWSVDGGKRQRLGGDELIAWTGNDHGGGTEATAGFVESVVKEANQLQELSTSEQGVNPMEFRRGLKALAANVGRMRDRLREYVHQDAAKSLSVQEEAGDSKLESFSAMSRRDRVTRLLLDEETGLLPRLKENQDVEVFVVSGNRADEMWWQRRGGRKQSGPLPTAIFESSGPPGWTNLSDPVRDSLDLRGEGVAALVLSDGRHNEGTPPSLLGDELGGLGIPVFTIGFGSEQSPHDIAISAVEAPEAVYFMDRVRGEIHLNDHMPAAVKYRLSVASLDGEVLWAQPFETGGSRKTSLPFEIDLQALTESRRKKARVEDEMDLRAVPLHLEARLERLDADGEEEVMLENNRREFSIFSTTQRRKVLIVDARPRWETRYISSVFERDERWEVNALIEFLAPNEKLRGWLRGNETGKFPGSKEALFAYDLIVLGEVAPSLFREDEIEWMEEFVSKRGGGLILIDGKRGHLARHERTAIGKLIPIRWTGMESVRGDMDFQLTETGATKPWMQIGASPAESNARWRDLPGPRWSAPVVALPGTETLVEGISDGTARPVIVTRRYGAGKIIYSGADEWWRWRYDVGDAYHGRLWNQATQWVCEPPFAVQGKFVSLGMDRLAVETGETVQLRARVRDASGSPVDRGDYVAVISEKEDGHLVAEVELAPDVNGGGIFRGQTPPLLPGVHEIAIRPKYDGAEFPARAEFVVGSSQGREFDELTLGRRPLEELASASRGHFFLEEETPQLPELLESIDRKRVLSSETILWSSYWWFLPIMFLLTTEWALRKKAGMM
ncbi:MAG: PA14 domain-containing protein [Verrucomicrobiota bacterium]